MVERSVPGYAAIQLLLADLAIRNASPSGVIYDLGCSTGSTLQAICLRQNQGLTLYGLDNSPAMVEKCRTKMANLATGNTIEVFCQDLGNEDVFAKRQPEVVILCLILQFIAPSLRPQLLQKIWENLPEGGVLLLVEKTQQENAKLDQLYNDYYHFYKREMGYSALEVSQKREALENVLIPLTPTANKELLQTAGFTTITTFFQWINFVGFLAVK